ncbi:MAG TPA: ABC-type transport auxiliary lipoprotein family protein [Caulobacteraceae bacterium]|jgi:cholesterol transport system auxiliary component
MTLQRLARAAAPAVALTLAIGLAGCITLFPKPNPQQLYRFGADVPPAAGGQTAAFTVRDDGLDFDKTAGTDQILIINGDQAGYIDGGRWASPAPILFDNAVHHGFDVAGGRVRMLGDTDPGKADLLLSMSVTRFEARGQGTGAPTVTVRLHAILTRQDTLAVVGDQVFEANAPASDNRIGPIVDAFDQATTKVVGDMVAWVNSAR